MPPQLNEAKKESAHRSRKTTHANTSVIKGIAGNERKKEKLKPLNDRARKKEEKMECKKRRGAGPKFLFLTLGASLGRRRHIFWGYACYYAITTKRELL